MYVYGRYVSPDDEALYAWKEPHHDTRGPHTKKVSTVRAVRQ